MAEIIQFPIQDPPPHRPTSAVKDYLSNNKCNAIISARVPFELKRYLMAEAYVSDARFSEHLARILSDHAIRKGQQGGLAAA